jgi:membrane-associated phospholipid phosphatase
MKKVLGFYIIFFFAGSLLARAQDTSYTIVDDFVSDFIISWEDGLSFFSAPIHFSGEDWLYAAGLTAGTFILFTADDKIRENVLKIPGNEIWDVPVKYGHITYANIFGAALYTAGLFSREEGIRTTGRLLIESLTFSGMSALGIRFLTGRRRPYHESGAWNFTGFKATNEFHSFPSGHTVVAFAVSTVFAERLDNIWGRIGFYGLASLTAIASVHRDQHFLSDVFIGAALGFAAGKHVVSREEARKNNKKIFTENISFYPSVNGFGILYRLN